MDIYRCLRQYQDFLYLFQIYRQNLGGTNPIGIDEYYQNAAISYTSGIAGIPNTGAIISLNMFYGKS
jgi:hypothetical protein